MSFKGSYKVVESLDCFIITSLIVFYQIYVQRLCKELLLVIRFIKKIFFLSFIFLFFIFYEVILMKEHRQGITQGRASPKPLNAIHINMSCPTLIPN